MASPARVFISYSSNDVALVNRLKDDLKRADVDVWLDHERLKPGTPDWRQAVIEGAKQATTIIYAASPTAATSPYVDHELAIAKEESTPILPFWVAGDRWTYCAPFGGHAMQYIDGRGAAYTVGLAALLVALGALPVTPPQPAPQATPARDAPQPAERPIATQAAAARVAPQIVQYRPAGPAIPPERFPARLARLGYTAHARDGVEWIVPSVRPVPAGPFKLGSDKTRDSQARDSELNRRVVTLPDYAIARFPVTVAEYACFVTATGRKQPGIWSNQLQRPDHPVVFITYRDAYDYADWMAQHTNQPWRLPIEAEWEKAARCDPRDLLGASSERVYPWGDGFDTLRCNTHESTIGRTTFVGAYGPDNPEPDGQRRSGASPCGAEDMAGNVWEWTASEYASDYRKSEQQAAVNPIGWRMLRGGSWGGGSWKARAAFRQVGEERLLYGCGFRLVLAALRPSS